ncbi:concanavalin A-like lectin/glucanase domain-containing protein [Crepidotus variabilis]|uniref:Concanavalin A-like lectin/glucanase domain-containing protein n=1 Tax=Crepidotus variabilis TaxID=179855 RepID=A0A9P6ERJ4_9AGAR|nr:concanavalin A-like lectin/glucanase domain-containing protein [Crepidotus variabilis]
MYLPLCLISLLLSAVPAEADNIDALRPRRPLPNPSDGNFFHQPQKRSLTQFQELQFAKRAQAADGGGINYNPDGSAFLWLPDDVYSGKNFFDSFNFFSQADPTDGHVNYVNASSAFAKGLAYVTDDNKVVMRTDSWTKLPLGTFRDSVRVQTKKLYTGGLFIIDMDSAPWGCAVWPGFWTTGLSIPPVIWPAEGEIDVLEGVHDNEHNQIAWHTIPGCVYDNNAVFSGTIPNDSGVNRTNCDASLNDNAGCNVVEWSRASYGELFKQQGGGVIAMKWDENDISIWSFFRAAVPQDITANSPNPSLWGSPSARLMNTKCNIQKTFANHTVIFDITLCGQWAGNSYATTNCPGTCDERLVEPANFINSSWSINSLKTYRKHLLAGNITQINDGSFSADSSLLTTKLIVLLGSVTALLAISI